MRDFRKGDIIVTTQIVWSGKQWLSQSTNQTYLGTRLPNHMVGRTGKIDGIMQGIYKYEVLFLEKMENGLVTFDRAYISKMSVRCATYKEREKYHELERKLDARKVAEEI